MTNCQPATGLIKQHIHRADSVIIIIAVLVLLSLYHTFWGQGGFGAQASIYVQGKFHTRVNLYQNQALEVEGPLGISQLMIEDGKIRFIKSPCTTKICIQQGWIESGGETAICLPNGISVQIDSPDPRYDSINF